MNFDRRKLPSEAKDQLTSVPAGVFRPNQFLGVPVYIHMELNQKFVSVKGPLGFFSAADLEKFSKKGDLFVHSFARRIETAQSVGDSIKKMLQLKLIQPVHTNQGEVKVQQPPHSLQLHETSLRLLAQVWGRELWVEPYFLAILALEICGPVPEEQLKIWSSESVDRLELALVRACTAVFFGLHLGWVDPVWLGSFRQRFLASHFGGPWPTFGDQAQLKTMIEKMVPSLDEGPIEMRVSRAKIAVEIGKTALGGKLISAINQIDLKWLRQSDPSHTIFGSDPMDPGLREAKDGLK